MAKAFGIWFREYSGDDEVISTLSFHWDCCLNNDYLKPSQYTTPEDVATRLKQGFSNKEFIQTHVYRAFEEYTESKRS